MPDPSDFFSPLPLLKFLKCQELMPDPSDRLIQQTPQFSETKDCRRQRAEPRKVRRAASVQSRELNFRFPLSAFRFPLSAFRFSAFRFKAFACSSAHVPIVGLSGRGKYVAKKRIFMRS